MQTVSEMFKTQELTALAAVLQTATPEEITACDRMYSATYRYEAVSIKDMYFSGLNDKAYLIDELLSSAYIAVYILETGTQAPTPPPLDNEYCSDRYGYAMEALAEEAQSYCLGVNKIMVVDDDTLVCDLCNYKGESEWGDTKLYDLVKKLPIYKNKAESFNQANRGFS